MNYTGSWVEGEREGNGTTRFKDGAVYQGRYKKDGVEVKAAQKMPSLSSYGLENGPDLIRYQNGNTLDAEFVEGKIQGHGVFR